MSIFCCSVSVGNISLHFQTFILSLIVIIQWYFCAPHRDQIRSSNFEFISYFFVYILQFWVYISEFFVCISQLWVYILYFFVYISQLWVHIIIFCLYLGFIRFYLISFVCISQLWVYILYVFVYFSQLWVYIKRFCLYLTILIFFFFIIFHGRTKKTGLWGIKSELQEKVFEVYTI